MLVVCAAALLAFQSREITAQSQRVVEGILKAQYEDYADSARITHFLNTGTEPTPVRFQRPTDRRLLHGSRVRLRGTMSDGTLMLTEGTDLNALSIVAPVSPN